MSIAGVAAPVPLPELYAGKNTIRYDLLSNGCGAPGQCVRECKVEKTGEDYTCIREYKVEKRGEDYTCIREYKVLKKRREDCTCTRECAL